MSVSGMQAWLNESGVGNQIFAEVDSSEEGSKLTPTWREHREHFNRLIDDKKSIGEILGEKTKGNDLMALMLVMVLIEDRGVAISGIPSVVRRRCELIRGYLLHTGDGGRALPLRGDTQSITERRRELVNA
ncbi:hypothetical protein KI440_01050 [Candidatus Saccharibacteria bacterium TM7i]|nr:hypothetical protein KI440_01050 [Candidatus Saccharibacteria bacterium TM7i]